MSATLRTMTLRQLLEQHGVTCIKQLCEDLTISRQYGWNLWHAEQGVGPVMMNKLHKKYHIPYADLMALEPVSPPKPRGRPKRQPNGEGHAK